MERMGNGGCEVADVEALVGGLGNYTVQLLGDEVGAGVVAGHRDVLELERAGRLLKVVEEALELRRVVHLIELLVEFADEVKAYTFLLHLFKSFAEVLDLLLEIFLRFQNVKTKA